MKAYVFHRYLLISLKNVCKEYTGTAALIGERAQATLRGRPRGRLGAVGSSPGWRLRASPPLRFNPGSRSSLIAEQFRDAPDMIRESCCHGRCTRTPEMG